MKTYISILLVVLGLGVIIAGGYIYTKKNVKQSSVVMRDDVRMKVFTSSLSRVHDGDKKLEYSFIIPEYATATTDKDGALTRVMTATSSYVTVYVSYEGGRGFTPLDYINEIIAPHVSVINPINVVTIGNNTWQVAESEGSEWHIAPVASSTWLFIVENKKFNHDLVEKTLESVTVK